MTTAFVLSGGASHGAVQVGMLMALAKRGIRPDLIVGTSVGALNGAWVAGRPDLGDLDELAAVWESLSTGSVFPLSPPRALAGVVGLSDHLVPASGLERIIRRHMVFERIEDAPTRFAVVATRVLTGEEEVITSGDAVDAILASAAIPGIFQPVEIDGQLLMDGGVSDNTPIAAAVELGADRLYVLPAGYACALTQPPRSALGMALHAFTISLEQSLMIDVSRFEQSVELHLIPPLCPVSVSPVDFSQSADLVRRADWVSGQWLDSHTVPKKGQARWLSLHPHRTGPRAPSTGRSRREQRSHQPDRGLRSAQ
jgi:NTE family protein